MSEPDRTTLPLAAPEFGGTASHTLRGSPPPGAPNVLLVLIDEAGFGNPSTFCGPACRADAVHGISA
jgi:arylsulfatase